MKYDILGHLRGTTLFGEHIQTHLILKISMRRLSKVRQALLRTLFEPRKGGRVRLIKTK